jgi:hypothetical protein
MFSVKMEPIGAHDHHALFQMHDDGDEDEKEH